MILPLGPFPALSLVRQAVLALSPIHIPIIHAHGWDTCLCNAVYAYGIPWVRFIARHYLAVGPATRS
jgi:hypothetical protein